MEGREIFSATGKAGMVLFFHDLILHGSYENMAHRSRPIIYLTYNRLDNAPAMVAAPRPEFVASRNFSPVLELESSLG